MKFIMNMGLCQCLEEFWTKHRQNEEVALIQNSGEVEEDEEVQSRVEVSYAQVYQWQQKLRLALDTEDDQEWLVVGINLAPFSIEETVVMVAVAQQMQWIYVPVDVQLPLARQLLLLQSAGVRRLVTTADSPLDKFFTSRSGDDKEMKLWAIGLKSSPFETVRVLLFPSGYFKSGGNEESELDCTRRRLNDETIAAPLYVLFTSGTTGKPRGVLGTRLGAWTRLNWMWKKYPFVSGERVLRATKLSFVDSVWEILGAFLQSVSLVHVQISRRHGGDNNATRPSVMKSVVLDDTTRFLEAIRTEHVSRFTSVPSVLEMLLLQTTRGALRTAMEGLRYVLSSGESLSLHVVQQVTTTLPNVTILNLYGSTEVSGDVTFMELKAPLSSAQVQWQQRGIPIADLGHQGIVGTETSLALLSDDHETTSLPSSGIPSVIWPMKSVKEAASAVEQSERGMLYISSPLVALGYVDSDPEDSFVASDILWSKRNGSRQERLEPARRWFCTGDVCAVVQGHLYFYGRKDNAVKIHGQRVYVEAVERAVTAALEELAKGKRSNGGNSSLSVTSRHVVAFTTTKTVSKYALLQQCIVACIMDDDGCSAPVTRYPLARALNAWIKEHYGSSHTPHEVWIVRSNAVKRVAHGKVDRRSLKGLVNASAGDNGDSFTKLNTCTKCEDMPEKLVAKLLKDILDIPLSDDVSEDLRLQTFTELGGNSLLATLFMYELRQSFGVLPLTIQDFGMTIGEILSIIESRIRRGEDSGGEVKRRKAAHHAHPKGPTDNGNVHRDEMTQHNSLDYISRCNQSSMSINGIYLPTCYTFPLPSSAEMVTATLPPWRLRRVWEVDLGKCIDASPLVVQRRDSQGSVCSTWVIVGSHSAQLVCVDVQNTGREIWKVALDDRIEACAALSVKHELVYVGTYAGSLFALDLQSGEIHWRFEVKETIKSSALVIDTQQLVVFGAYDCNLYGLDSLTGQQRWAINLEGSIFSTPLYCAWSCQLFAASTNGNVVALTPTFNCFKMQWQLQLPAPVFAGLNADCMSEMLIVGCADGQLYGVSMVSGDIQWQISTEKPLFSSPCVYRPGSVVFGSHDGMLRKVDCHDGKLIWTTNLHSAVFASPTVIRLTRHSTSGETGQNEISSTDQLTCCVTTTGGSMYFCDETTGSIVYQTCESTGDAMIRMGIGTANDDLGPLFSSPVLIDQWCLFGTRTNHFYGFELVRGSSGKIFCASSEDNARLTSEYAAK